jgi:hypothetical protein
LEEYGTYETDVRQIFLFFFLNINLFLKYDLQQFQIFIFQIFNPLVGELVMQNKSWVVHLQ